MDRQPLVVKTLGAHWGQHVADRRRELHLTQKQLADLCGIEQQTISKIENGDMIPLDRLKVEIARRLRTSPSDLFAWPSMADLAAAGEPA